MKKKQWLYFLFVFLVPVVGITWWWGQFADVTVEAAQPRGPYRYAYLVQNGDYAKLPEAQQTALREMKTQGIAPGAPITLLLNDPRTTPHEQRAAQVGYLVDAAVKVRDPLRLAEIPVRPAIVVRLQAHPRIAPGKAYTALMEHLQQHHLKLNLPTLETWQNGEFILEMGV